jgi:hypothetical protein
MAIYTWMTIESEDKHVEMLNLKKTTKKERKINFNKVKHMLTRKQKK